jgi:phage shock protein C
METKKLYRSDSNRILAGVAGGIAEYFNIDATIVRLAFFIMAFANGFGLLAYIIAWIVIPEHPDHKASKSDKADKFDEVERKIEAAAEDIARNVGGSNRGIGIVLILIGLFFLLQNILPNWFGFHLIWPVIIIVVGAWILLGSQRR